MQHLDLPAAVGTGADADGGDIEPLGDPPGDDGGHDLEHDRVGAGLLQGLRVAEHAHGVARGAPLDLVAAHGVHGLRGEADVAHHRDAGVDEALDDLRRALSALQLDGAAAGLLHDPGGVAHRALPAGLVGAERHVDHDVRALCAAHYRRSVVDHVLHRHRQGRVVAEDDHPERVADKDDRDAGLVGEARRRVVVGRDHRDRLALAVHPLQVADTDALHACGHRPAPSATGSRNSAGWAPFTRLESVSWATRLRSSTSTMRGRCSARRSSGTPS